MQIHPHVQTCTDLRPVTDLAWFLVQIWIMCQEHERHEEGGGRGAEACLNDHMVDHFIAAKAWPNDDGVKALQPVLDGTQRLVKNLLLLVLRQLYARKEG